MPDEEKTPPEEELAPNEEIHILNAGGFVPGLPGMHGPGTRVVVDSASGQPLRVLAHPVPEAPPESATDDAAHQAEHPVDEMPVQEVQAVEQEQETNQL